MTIDQAVELGRDAILQTLIISTPLLGAAIVVGLVVSILQTVTQIQDQTLGFVPKIAGMLLVLLYVIPWILNRMVTYATNVIQDIP